MVRHLAEMLEGVADVQLWNDGDDGAEEVGFFSGRWTVLDLGAGGEVLRIRLDTGQSLHIGLEGVTGEETFEQSRPQAPRPGTVNREEAS